MLQAVVSTFHTCRVSHVVQMETEIQGSQVTCPRAHLPRALRIQAQVFLTPELVFMSPRLGARKAHRMICQAIAGSALVLLPGVLAPDLQDRKKADKGGQHPCDLPKGRTKRRVGVWIWRNPVFRNKNTFKKRERGKEET